MFDSPAMIYGCQVPVVKTQVNVSKEVRTPINVSREESKVDKPPALQGEEAVTVKPEDKPKVLEENKTAIKRPPENDSQEGMTTVKIIEETIIQDDELEDVDEEEDEEEEEEDEVMDTTQSTEQAVEEVEIAGYELETEDIDKDMEGIQAVEEHAGGGRTKVNEASSQKESNEPSGSNEVVSEAPPSAFEKGKEEAPVKKETVVEEKPKKEPVGEQPTEQQQRGVPPPEQPEETVHHHQHYIGKNRKDPNTRIQEIHRHKKKIKSEAKAMKSKKRRKQIEKTSWTNCLYGFGTDFIPSVSWFRLLLFGEVMTEAMEDWF
ncbi:hypothetical protein Btru_067624 [Bulinus truncatus]|nr:hypothetical protein Btru_067624 [Bulinus truncatus]